MSNEPPSQTDANADRAERMRVYRRRYWERFRETRRRVYGTLTADEYAAIEQRAQDAGRAVWEQLHAEAEAYARGRYLPSKEVEQSVAELIEQLRRVGNNLNQIARALNLDHDLNQRGFVEALDELEALVRAFVRKPWGYPHGENDDPLP